jgi:hypothetical protein
VQRPTLAACAPNPGLIQVSELAAYVEDLVPKLVAGGEARAASSPFIAKEITAMIGVFEVLIKFDLASGFGAAAPRSCQTRDIA